MLNLGWGACSIALLAGTALGAGITIKFLDKEYEQNLAKEIDKARKHFSRLHKTDAFSDPVALVEVKEDAGGIILEQKYATIETAKTQVAKNVFTDVKEFDLGEEIKKRGPDRPYVITEEEYFAGEANYEQKSLNFYDGDGVLSDQGDEYLRESDDIVGDDNLLRFGEGSNDKNVVYVRNDKLECDYEVIRTRGKYAEIVHGIIEHSDRKRKVPKKFRQDD